MQHNNDNETICAVATAMGAAGIGVIRISGPKACAVGKTILKKETLVPRYAHFSKFYGTDKVLDEGIAIFYPGPHSFTGEDVLELQGHSGAIILDRVLKEVISLGPRMALPGEFTERAVLNNKMDLLQAESLLGMIHAESEAALDASIKSLSGAFSNAVNAVIDKITHLRMHIESLIDFSDEDIEHMQASHIQMMAKELQSSFNDLFSRAKTGALLSSYPKIVFLGETNAGKSSLLNLLAQKDVAIVTDVHGTTRDVNEKKVSIGSLVFDVVDTAGVRETKDIVEQKGIEKTWSEIKEASLVIVVFDGEKKTSFDIYQQYPDWAGRLFPHQKILAVVNKVDKLSIEPKVDLVGGVETVFMSAQTGAGQQLLLDSVSRHYLTHGFEGAFYARRRHLSHLQDAEKYLCAALKHRDGYEVELMAEALGLCQRELGFLTGHMSSDDLLGHIFSEFCIGK